jgi:hypothetical protein
VQADSEHTPTEVERARIRKLSSRGQGRVCPSCGKPTLFRRRRPFFLRWLRLIGIEVRTYECAMCSYVTAVRTDPTTAQRSAYRSGVAPAGAHTAVAASPAADASFYGTRSVVDLLDGIRPAWSVLLD